MNTLRGKACQRFKDQSITKIVEEGEGGVNNRILFSLLLSVNFCGGKSLMEGEKVMKRESCQSLPTR